MAFCGGAVSGGPCLPALEHCSIRQFCAASTSRTRAQTFPKVEPRCCFPRPIQKASFPCLPISWLSFRGGENSTGAKAQALEQPLTRPESRHFKNSAFLPNSAFLRMQSECRVFKLHNATFYPPHLRLKCVVDASIPGRLVRQRLIASAAPRRYAGEGQVKHSRGSNQPLPLSKVNSFW